MIALDRWQENFVEHTMQAYYRQVGRPERYASECGAGDEGSPGFQSGNTCGGEGGTQQELPPKESGSAEYEEGAHGLSNEEFRSAQFEKASKMFPAMLAQDVKENTGFDRPPEWWSDKISSSEFEEAFSEKADAYGQGEDYASMDDGLEDVGDIVAEVMGDQFSGVIRESIQKEVDDRTPLHLEISPEEFYEEHGDPGKIMQRAANLAKTAEKDADEASDEAYQAAKGLGRITLLPQIREAIDSSGFPLGEEERKEIEDAVMDEFNDQLDEYWNEDALSVGDSFNPYAAASMAILATSESLREMQVSETAYDKIIELSENIASEYYSLERSFQAFKYALAKSGHFRLEGDVTKYASDCGAGSEGNKGFQSGNTCASGGGKPTVDTKNATPEQKSNFLRSEIRQLLTEPKTKRHHKQHSNLVSIPDLRDRMGDAFSTEEFDRSLQNLRRSGEVRLISTSDRSETTPEERDKGIQLGFNDEFFYVQPQESMKPTSESDRIGESPASDTIKESGDVDQEVVESTISSFQRMAQRAREGDTPSDDEISSELNWLSDEFSDAEIGEIARGMGLDVRGKEQSLKALEGAARGTSSGTPEKNSVADDRAFRAVKYALAHSNYFRLEATRQTPPVATIQA